MYESKRMSEIKRAKKVSKSAKAGIIFPVGRLRTKLRKGNYADRIGNGAAIFMGAAIEYLTAEIVELAGMAAHDNHKQRINPRYIMLAIKNDSELEKLLGQVTICESGVVPNINPALLKEQSNRKKNDEVRVPSQEY